MNFVSNRSRIQRLSTKARLFAEERCPSDIAGTVDEWQSTENSPGYRNESRRLTFFFEHDLFEFSPFVAEIGLHAVLLVDQGVHPVPERLHFVICIVLVRFRCDQYFIRICGTHPRLVGDSVCQRERHRVAENQSEDPSCACAVCSRRAIRTNLVS